MKTRQDNDVTDCIGAIYVENKTGLLWLIKSGIICDENQIGQWHDWSYRYGLLQNRNLTVKTYMIGCGLWWKSDRITMRLIILV